MPSARYPEGTVDEIRSHLENCIYNPSVAVPPSLAGFSFRKLQSCTDVISNFLKHGSGRTRGVDMVFIDRGTEATKRNHADPILNRLSVADIDTLGSFFDKYHHNR